MNGHSLDKNVIALCQEISFILNFHFIFIG